MKKLIIREFQYANGSYCILLCNAGLDLSIYLKLKNIIKHFSQGDKLFLGHYKLDGTNISHNLFIEYASIIPQFFRANGNYQIIYNSFPKKTNKLYCAQELFVCSAPNNGETYEIIDKAFHYYLETTVICPKIDWETFVLSFSNYTSNITLEYVLNGYSDFLFSYSDSGDFSIIFNPEVFDPQAIRKIVDNILKS